MPRKRRKSSREDILRVFAERVARDGYSETSISDVAGDLGLSKGTIVHHFNSKLELLEHTHVAFMERRLSEAHHVLSILSTPTSQLAAMIYALLKSHRDDRAATVSFLREFLRFSEFTATVRTQRDTYASLVQSIVRRGIERGEFRREDPTLVTLQLFGMCNYAWTWYRPEGRFSLEDIAKSFIRTFLIGICKPSTSDSKTLDPILSEAFKAVKSAPIGKPKKA
jgi:TetR/AcrR family transcriptional regulator, cholesterol catabolism regulator